jgi:hypothetical protein
VSGGLSSTEVDAARRRFEQDQADAEYVEFTYAMERIGGGRRWRRGRRRLLRTRGLELGSDPGEPPRR